MYEPIPESGGPFGGRNQALAVLCGMYRSKRVPFDVALPVIQQWNRDYCQPPLPEREVHNLVGRAWVQWAEGKGSDMTPEEARGETVPIEFLTLSDMERVEKEIGAMHWLLENVLPEGGLVYLSAPPAGAKTWVMMDLIRAFVTGSAWLEKYQVQPRNVLWIDEEMGVRKSLPRLRKLGIDTETKGLWYTNKAGVKFDNPQHVNAIKKFVEEHEIGCICVDSLTRVHNMDEDKNSQMRYLFQQFSYFLDMNVMMLLTHHNRKKGAESDVRHEQMRGAGDIAAMADCAYSIDKVGHMFRLTTTKGRLVAEEDQISVDFMVEDNEMKTQTRLYEVDPIVKARQRTLDTERRILDALLSGEKNINDLRKAVGGRASDVNKVASDMADSGVLSLRMDGQKKIYRLADDDTDEAAY